MKLLSRLTIRKNLWWQSLAVGLLLLTGCSQGATFSGSGDSGLIDATLELPTRAPTTAPTAANTRVLPLDSLTPAPTPTITPIPDEVLGLVVQVINGDTIAVVMEGDPPALAYEVSYIGVEAPPNNPSTPWGVVSYETNRKMTGLKVVRLVRDETELDEDGRLLRHVYVDNQLMSIVLAEQGLAEAVDSGANNAFQTEITAAESRAQAANLGLWGEAAPTATPIRETTDEPTGEPTDEAEATPEADSTPPAETGTSEPEPGETTPEATDEPQETVTPTEEATSEPTAEASPTRTLTPEPTATEEE